jgi:NAD(P)H dehydrogenase (quinone)
LYADKFNPVLEFPDIQYSFMDGEAPSDVKIYQEQITWADQITFVYPIWWEQMPAMLKGFIDRVFTNGYAYVYGENGPKGLLVGKSVQLLINTGNTSEILEKMGMHAAVKKVNEEGIFKFCGMTAKTTFFGNITLGSDHDRKQYLNSIRDIISE